MDTTPKLKFFHQTMNKASEYNGFSNKQTWNVAMWIAKDPEHYQKTKEKDWGFIAVYVWEQFYEHNKFGDLTSEKEMAMVDWDEIAESCHYE